MKKFIILAVALALLAPASAFAKAEFYLGGYIKLNTFWDSTQNNSNLVAAVQRDNNVNFHHGRLNMKASESRFNLTIKGPKVFGAQTSGLFEIDFDGTTDQNVSASGTWVARMRHAMFRLNWPETELMLGQYHSIFASWSIDAAESSAFQMTGTVTARLPQIRLTQKFLGDWSVAGMVGLPQTANLTSATPYSTTVGNGSSAETPQIQGMLKYAHDWWGKAAYFGHPKPFTVQVTAGWQRNINVVHNYNNTAAGGNLWMFDQTNYTAVQGIVKQQFVNPWMVQGTLFIPVIPTHSANLAGTASILTQWFIGQGVEVFGVSGNTSNRYHFVGTFGATNYYDVSLLNRFGGLVQAQYYFTNQWYLNAAYGITRCYGLNRDQDVLNGSNTASNDQFRTVQQVDATLWYQPVKALKFGVQYAFANTQWFQKTNTGGAGTPNLSDYGVEHRVQFVGFLFF
jgi:hypothetical protein